MKCLIDGEHKCSHGNLSTQIKQCPIKRTQNAEMYQMHFQGHLNGVQCCSIQSPHCSTHYPGLHRDHLRSLHWTGALKAFISGSNSVYERCTMFCSDESLLLRLIFPSLFIKREVQHEKYCWFDQQSRHFTLCLLALFSISLFCLSHRNAAHKAKPKVRAVIIVPTKQYLNFRNRWKRSESNEPRQLIRMALHQQR